VSISGIGTVTSTWNNPNDGVVFLDRMIRTWYCVGRLDGTRWYEIPVFTGPITKVDKDSYLLSVECTGKEVLGQDALRRPKTYHKGWKRTQLIKTIMGDLAGEQFMRVSSGGGKTAAPVVVAGQDEITPFAASKKLGADAHMDVFYNALGQLIVRDRRLKHKFKWTDARVQDAPQASYNFDEFYNAVEVTGSKPKHAKKPVSFLAVAPRKHPLSPQSLKRDDTPRYRTLRIQDDKLKTVHECRRKAEAMLKHGLVEAIDASFSVAGVLPMIEEYDVTLLDTEEFTGAVSCKQATIPLVVDDVMSFGYNKNVRPHHLARHIRRA
jgi:hypothetical protein